MASPKKRHALYFWIFLGKYTVNIFHLPIKKSNFRSESLLTFQRNPEITDQPSTPVFSNQTTPVFFKGQTKIPNTSSTFPPPFGIQSLAKTAFSSDGEVSDWIPKGFPPKTNNDSLPRCSLAWNKNFQGSNLQGHDTPPGRMDRSEGLS